jgi:biotin operon repressor
VDKNTGKILPLGRPPLSKTVVTEIRNLRNQGVSIRKIATTLEMSTTTVQKYIRA